MKILLIILLLVISNYSYSQKISFEPDSSKLLLYKRAKGYSNPANEYDGFCIKRTYYGVFIIDNYYYPNETIPYQTDTLLQVNDRWLINKEKKWQSWFYTLDFQKGRKWQVNYDGYCYLFSPIRTNITKKGKIYVFNKSYCNDLGNNMDTDYYFDPKIGIIKMRLSNGLIFELTSISQLPLVHVREE